MNLAGITVEMEGRRGEHGKQRVGVRQVSSILWDRDR